MFLLYVAILSISATRIENIYRKVLFSIYINTTYVEELEFRYISWENILTFVIMPPKTIPIPPWYKSSPLGLIPSEWKVEEMKKITTLITNWFVWKATDHYVAEDGILYIQWYNAQESGFDFHGVKYVSREFHEQHKKSQLREGDLLTIQTWDVGVTAYVTKELEGSNCHALIISRYINTVAYSKYYHQFFNSPLGRKFLKIIETGSTMKHLNCGDMETLKLPVPPLEEQVTIANLLSTWDEAISKVLQLIELNEKRRKWLTEELLSWRKRLDWFKDNWKNITFGDFLSESRIHSDNSKINKRITVRLECRWIEERNLRWTEVEDGTNFYTRRAWQFIYGKQNLHKGAFGIIPDYLDWYESSQDLPTFDFINGIIIPEFFITYLSQENTYKSLENLSTWTWSKRIQPKELFKVRISPPSEGEQRAIMCIINNSNQEIQLLKTKLEKLKEQKKWLMQQLLTGKKRLKF